MQAIQRDSREVQCRHRRAGDHVIVRVSPLFERQPACLVHGCLATSPVSPFREGTNPRKKRGPSKRRRNSSTEAAEARPSSSAATPRKNHLLHLETDPRVKLMRAKLFAVPQVEGKRFQGMGVLSDDQRIKYIESVQNARTCTCGRVADIEEQQ
eukprot:GHVU01054796.1.p1 GENE.GHVU01054796.1~~GHVU01054796.1.p1  ORF type:complete len:154 (-),score=10.78 GHVU01054796.1:48-509(-)